MPLSRAVSGDVVADRGAVGDRLAFGPGLERVAERVHVGVRAHARIAEQVPGAADRRARFQDRVASCPGSVAADTRRRRCRTGRRRRSGRRIKRLVRSWRVHACLGIVSFLNTDTVHCHICYATFLCENSGMPPESLQPPPDPTAASARRAPRAAARPADRRRRRRLRRTRLPPVDRQGRLRSGRADRALFLRILRQQRGLADRLLQRRDLLGVGRDHGSRHGRPDAAGSPRARAPCCVPISRRCSATRVRRACSWWRSAASAAPSTRPSTRRCARSARKSARIDRAAGCRADPLLEAGIVGGVIHIALRWIEDGYTPGHRDRHRQRAAPGAWCWDGRRSVLRHGIRLDAA
jgi:hypothetical protein